MRRRSAVWLAIVLALALLAPATVYAAEPPPNDMFANATVVTFAPGSPSALTADTTAATSEAGERDTCATGAARSVWYRFTPAAFMTATVDVSGTAFADVKVARHIVRPDGSLSAGICATGPSMTWIVGEGYTYYVQVTDAGSGGGLVQIVFSAVPPPPPNDARANAVTVTGATFDHTVDTSSATSEAGERDPCNTASPATPPARSVWYTFTPSGDGSVTVDVTGTTFADVRIARFIVPAAGGLSIGVCMSPTSMTFPIVAGRTYFIQASDAGSGGGILRIRFTGVEPPPPPAPANDDFASAGVVSTLPFTATVDTAYATEEAGEPSYYCSRSNRTVWYAITAAVNGIATVDPAGSAIPDVSLTAYRSTAADFADLTALTCANGTNAVSFGVEAGVTYYVQAADGGTGGGSLGLTFSLAAAPPPPPNDAFADATVLAGPPFTDPEPVEIGGATAEPSEPIPCGGSSRSVWYTVAPETAGAVIVDTTAATSFGDRILGAYVSSGGDLGSLSQVGCNQWGPLAFNVTPGTTYYIRASDVYSGGGTLGLTFSFTPPLPNDDFASAADVTGPSSVDTIDLRSATREASEPSACGYGDRQQTAWYRYTAAADATMVVSRSGPAAWATAEVAFRADGPDLDDLVPITCPTSGLPTVFQVREGATYFVQVFDTGLVTGDVELGFSLEPPVPNDDVADASAVPAFPFTDSVDITYASAEPGEDSNARSVWYAFTPTASGTLAVETGGAFYYTSLDLYRSSAPSPRIGDLTLVNNRYSSPFPFFASVEAGVTYYLRAAESRWGTGGVLEISIELVPPAPNDDLADAALVPSFPFSHSVDIRSATLEPGEKENAYYSPRTVWYAFTAPWDGSVTIDTAGSDFTDRDVNVYRAAGPDPGFDDLDWQAGGWVHSVTVAVQAGATYYVWVSDFGYGGGMLHIAFSITPPPDTAAPVVTVSGAAASYPVDAAISITATAIDAVDPAPAVTCTLTGPGAASTPAPVSCAYAADAWSLGALGTYVFAVTATDGSGNSASASATFDVVATYASVSNLTKAWSSKATVAKDLVAILDSAYAAEQRGQYTAESKKLAEYRAGVRAQSGKAFTVEMAGLLIQLSYEL